MAGIGVPELLIVLVILLLIFGPKRLPGLGKQLGGGMREFKDSITSKGSDEDDEDEDAGKSARVAPPALPEASAPAAAAPETVTAEPVAAPPAATPEHDPAAPPRP